MKVNQNLIKTQANALNNPSETSNEPLWNSSKIPTTIKQNFNKMQTIPLLIPIKSWPYSYICTIFQRNPNKTLKKKASINHSLYKKKKPWLGNFRFSNRSQNVIYSKYYKHWKWTAQCSHLSNQKIGWFLAD